MNSISAKERAWRARNPALAAKFDRLSAGAKANIRTNGFGKGTAELTRLADTYRREAVRERSATRRKRDRIRDRARFYANLTARQRHDQWDEFAPEDPFEQAVFWRTYDGLIPKHR